MVEGNFFSAISHGTRVFGIESFRGEVIFCKCWVGMHIWCAREREGRGYTRGEGFLAVFSGGSHYLGEIWSVSEDVREKLCVSFYRRAVRPIPTRVGPTSATRLLSTRARGGIAGAMFLREWPNFGGFGVDVSILANVLRNSPRDGCSQVLRQVHFSRSAKGGWVNVFPKGRTSQASSGLIFVAGSGGPSTVK